MKGSLALELVLFVLVGLFAWQGSGAAVEGMLEKAETFGGPAVRAPEAIRGEAREALGVFLVGLFALALSRAVSLKRGRGSVSVPLLLPAACAAATLGFALQSGFGDAVHRPFWPMRDFATGFAIAALVAAVPLLLRRDPVAVFAPLQALLPALMLGTFAALAVYGQGTELAPDTLINLGGIQPLELVKLAFVIYLAYYLGSRAAKLRYQRERVLGLSMPRPRLLAPAFMVLIGLFLAFVLVKDLGPTLILSMVFLALFYVATLSRGWVLAALGVVALGVYAAASVPAIAGSPKVALRMQMWLEPWTNAQAFGDQTGRTLWAVAAGGGFGQGLGFAFPGALPAAHTDLVTAHLAEELGAAGLLVYLALLGAIAGQGLWIAVRARTPERVLLATGLSVLLIAQWLVIFSGTMGLLPLTGVVVPYLSFGKTGMIVFLLLASLLARLAESGEVREDTAELVELRRASLGTLAAVMVLVLAGAGVALARTVILGPQTSVRGLVTRLAPEPGGIERIANVHDPRLVAIGRRVPRGQILDRNGEVIAGTAADGRRTYPLGDAMGTLLGPPDPVVLRPVWMLERILAPRLRGFPDLDEGPAVWLTGEAEVAEKALFVVPYREELAADRQRAEQMAGGQPVRLLPLPAPDMRPLLYLLHAGGRAREVELKRLAGDLAARSVRLTIDARLQVAAVQALRAALARNGHAAAAVVLDADTGQVLARAQVPDFDPGDARFRKRLEDPGFLYRDPKFTGIYGAWPDKTGLRGIFQGGSVTKVYTSIAAARAGLLKTPDMCPLKTGPLFGCLSRDGQGPVWNGLGWYKGIHDHPEDDPHGTVDFIKGLAVSCNIYFGQLGVKLGPGPLKELRAAGVEIGWDNYDPGPPNSRELALTAFGQGASLFSVLQLARMGGTVASGGVYRKCPGTMALDDKCEEKRILEEPHDMVPVLGGMQAVMQYGTGARQEQPPGLRIYGKTGTADSIGIEEEKPWKVVVGQYGTPHSWFLGIGEGAANTQPCDPATRGRVVAAVVVARAGKGAVYAGPAAMAILKAAQAEGYLPLPPEQAAAAAAGAQPAAPAGARTAAPAPPSPAPPATRRPPSPGKP